MSDLNEVFGSQNQETVSLDDVTKILQDETETVQPPAKRKRGRPKKIETETQTEQKVDEIEKASMSLSLIMLTQAIAKIIGENKWEISDRQEADMLAESTIVFLDKVFPNWRISSPYIQFISAWGSYVAKRILL